jgi:hypothetical protein
MEMIEGRFHGRGGQDDLLPSDSKEEFILQLLQQQYTKSSKSWEKEAWVSYTE